VAQRTDRLKWLLIGGAVVLTLALFLVPSGKDNMVQFSAKRTNSDEVEEPKNKLKNVKGDVTETTMFSPRYSGENNRGEQWLVTAQSASVGGGRSVSLKQIEATALIGTPHEIAVSASKGEYSPDVSLVSLTGHVVAKGQGAVFKTQELLLNPETLFASSTKAVSVVKGLTHINAQKFEMTKNGDVITFTDGVRVHFVQEK